MSSYSTIDISYVRDDVGVRVVGEMMICTADAADEVLQVLAALRPLLEPGKVQATPDSIAIRTAPPPAVQAPAEPEPAAVPRPAPPPVTSMPKSRAKPTMALFSEKRLALLRRDWPTDRSSRHITDDMNAMDGLFLNTKQVSDKAKSMGLRRPVGSASVPPIAPMPPPAPVQREPQPPIADATDDDDLEPVNASMEEIMAWARGDGGFLKSEGAPLPEVNAQRIAMSLPPFHLVRSGGFYNGEAEAEVRA